MGRYISTTGTASPVLRTATANFAATASDRILLDSSGGAFTVTLPAVAGVLEGDQIQLIEVGNSASSNNITVARNGANINGSAEDLTIDVNGSVVTLLYTNGTYGWVITSS